MKHLGIVLSSIPRFLGETFRSWSSQLRPRRMRRVQLERCSCNEKRLFVRRLNGARGGSRKVFFGWNIYFAARIKGNEYFCCGLQFIYSIFVLFLSDSTMYVPYTCHSCAGRQICFYEKPTDYNLAHHCAASLMQHSRREASPSLSIHLVFCFPNPSALPWDVGPSYVFL